MNKLKLNITDQAKSDIRLIAKFIAKDNKIAAKNTSTLLYKQCKDLAMYPKLGSLRSDFTYKDFRFSIVKKRYVIAYKVDGNNLYISRVFSVYQDICSFF